MRSRRGVLWNVSGCLAGGIMLLAHPGIVRAQVPLGEGGVVRIFNTDQAVLEAGDPRNDLPCTVTPDKPVLGFDLRFHAGYTVTVPLMELAGTGNLLTILFRVTPENHKDDPMYFTQRVRVPPIDADAKGDAYLQGTFDVGEGSYHIDWLMRDQAERVCSFYWDSDAFLLPKDKQMGLNIAPGAVHKDEGEEFKEEPPIERIQSEPPLNVKVLINFAPQDALSSTLRPSDTAALVSIVRSISRDPHIGKFSIVAFNMQEQRVIYRQENADRIDFPALGNALNSLNLGTVNLKLLSQKHGDTDFLADLIKQETGGPNHPDALIFAGPKVMLDENVPQDSLKQIGDIHYPVFYMNYNLNPQAVPWKDSISRAVRFFKGTEFTISRPRDLWYAVSEMVSRIVKSKHGSEALAASSQ
ncbi:MAG: acetyltransferase [Bryobacteraceae bacterium]